LSNIVIRLSDRTVKGTTDLTAWIEGIVDTGSFNSPVIHSSDGIEERVPLEDVKAVFFVKELAGTSHVELRYYDNHAPLPCLWIRAAFADGEVIEGIVRNGVSFIAKSRFLMAPVDPQSNNKLILVFKEQLVDCQILGLRKPFAELPEYLQDLEAQASADLAPA